MNRNSYTRHSGTTRQVTPGMIVCPACAGPLKPDSKWCPTCNFTGGDSMEIFPESPPPLLSILDAAGIFSDGDTRKIEKVMAVIGRRFPQFRWRVCSVILPPETTLPLFGFWLLNTCPLDKNETAEERAWTVLLLIDADSGNAAAIPGYAAELFLSADEWKTSLSTMASAWQAGNLAEAVICFLKNTRLQLEGAATRYGLHRPGRKIL